VFGVGLSNLQQRLALRYGERAVLSIEPVATGGVIARVVLPCGS
jgi:sensor histidine kinase YesM